MASNKVAQLNHIIDAKVSKQQPFFEKFFDELFMGYIETAIQQQTDNLKVLNADIGHYQPSFFLQEYNITSFAQYKQFIYDCIEKINSMGFRYKFDDNVIVYPKRQGGPFISFDQVQKNDIQWYFFEIHGTYNKDI